MRVSVLTTLYRSAAGLEEFHQRVSAAVSQITDDYELVFVDDGSPDDSLEAAKRILHSEHRIRIVELSRNYGHHRAIMEGLRHVEGDLVFLIDCDLEEPPELFLELVRKMQSAPRQGEPPDVVYAVQQARKGRVFERFSGWLFYRLFNLLSPIKVPPDAMVARLMTRRYVEALKAHGESELFLLGLMGLAGFRQESVVAVKRHRGSSSYVLRKRVASAMNAITSFSERPLWLVFALGLSLSLLSLLAILYLIFRVTVLGIRGVPGWASLLVSVCFFGGINILCVGIVGLYLARVFMEVKRRPVIIKKVTSNFPVEEPCPPANSWKPL